jgi:hypothetical protein
MLGIIQVELFLALQDNPRVFIMRNSTISNGLHIKTELIIVLNFLIEVTIVDGHAFGKDEGLIGHGEDGLELLIGWMGAERLVDLVMFEEGCLVLIVLYKW